MFTAGKQKAIIKEVMNDMDTAFCLDIQRWFSNTVYGKKKTYKVCWAGKVSLSYLSANDQDRNV